MNGVRVAGIPIQGPAKPETQSIEVGINRVFAAFALNQNLVFEDLHGFLDELQSYSRELDEMGEPTEKIEAKETFHPGKDADTVSAAPRSNSRLLVD